MNAWLWLLLGAAIGITGGLIFGATLAWILDRQDAKKAAARELERRLEKMEAGIFENQRDLESTDRELLEALDKIQKRMDEIDIPEIPL